MPLSGVLLKCFRWAQVEVEVLEAWRLELGLRYFAKEGRKVIVVSG